MRICGESRALVFLASVFLNRASAEVAAGSLNSLSFSPFQWLEIIGKFDDFYGFVGLYYFRRLYYIKSRV